MSEQELLAAIDRDRDELVTFLQNFVRQKGPNPPGDTRSTAKFVTQYLDRHGLAYRIIDPHPEYPNIVASFDGGAPGKHLVLNGHIDVFPVADDGLGWTVDPWGGELRDGKIYGRGVADMKCGTSASIFTYIYLSRIKDKLKGRLTLTAVSDEETFGPWGSRYLIEHHPEVRGDACLNGEPSSPYTVRFGEKGPLWLEFTVLTAGAHGAYTHATESATKTAFALAAELEKLGDIKPELSDNISRAIDAGRATMDKAMGPGAGSIVDKVTLNIGTIRGGVKVNMVPSSATFEADIRLPLGVSKERVLAEVETILGRFPNVTMKETNCNLPSWVDPACDIIEIVQGTVETLRGFKPTPIVSLGGTDARLWRYRNIPTCVYGPFPYGMGSFDEHVDVEEYLHIVRSHLLASYRYLTR
ncbi:MAG: M20/M25/M40 family metallo-hydrolase [Proteobacteria bacterium]|nr:M20/M25/M40 family metallo-hydrolase [Pseudomonadota bacterium]